MALPPKDQLSVYPASSDDQVIIDAPSPLQMTLEENRKPILIAIAAVLIAVLAWVVIRYTTEQKNLRAAEAYSAANTAEDFQIVAQKHPGTVAGGNALLSQAAELLEKKNAPADARVAAEQFLKDYPDHPLRDKALYLIAQAQEMNNEEKAPESYQALADNPATASSPFAALARLRLGDMARAKGDDKKAREIWGGIPRDFAGQSFAEIAKMRMDRLDAGLPTQEIDPPPAASATPDAPPNFDFTGKGPLALPPPLGPTATPGAPPPVDPAAKAPAAPLPPVEAGTPATPAPAPAAKPAAPMPTPAPAPEAPAPAPAPTTPPPAPGAETPKAPEVMPPATPAKASEATTPAPAPAKPADPAPAPAPAPVPTPATTGTEPAKPVDPAPAAPAPTATPATPAPMPAAPVVAPPAPAPVPPVTETPAKPEAVPAPAKPVEAAPVPAPPVPPAPTIEAPSIDLAPPVPGTEPAPVLAPQ